MDSYFQLYSAYSEVELPSPDLIWLSEKPLLVTILKPRNPKSIKPTDYGQSNIINSGMKDANNKRKALETCWYIASQGLRINRS